MRISPRVHRFLRATEPREADDLASDVWVALAARFGTFRGDARGFEALAFTIARRRVSDHRRRGRRRRTDVVAGDVFATRPAVDQPEAEAIEAVALRGTLAELATQLPPEQVAVVVLRVLAGWPVTDAAAVLDRSPGSVRVLQHRALVRIRRAAARP